MPEQVTVDGLEFARGAKTLAGSFEIADLGRLHDRLASTAGQLRYELVGYLDEKGRPSLRLRVYGNLELVCQRCLKGASWPVDLASSLLLVTSQAELEAEDEDPDAPDRLPAEKAMDVLALVEEEVLLGLPIAPKHAEGECAPAPAQDLGRAQSPFAALARLKRPGADQH